MNKSKINVYNVALVLFSLANVLELFIPRMDEGNYFIRMPIQMINGCLLILMWTALLHRINHWTPITKVILALIILTLIHSIIYSIIYQFNVSAFAPYIRLLLWTSSLIFFYEMMLKYEINKPLMQVYVVTFIIAVTKKILETPLFESETLGGGDTAALPLLFLIPVVLLSFGDKSKVLIISFISVLVLFSLRRTVILGFIICLPFIYKQVSRKLNTYHVIILGSVFIALIIIAWGYIGEAVLFRFENLLVGDGGGRKDSFGSGRSEFYLTVWNNWVYGGLFSFIFGYGLTSVEQLLMRVHNIKHAHNDFLEIGYTFGLIGIAIWFLFIGHFLQLRKQIKTLIPESINLFYICMISYLIISMASGCSLRITTMPFAFTVSILLYQVQKAKLLSEAAKRSNLEEKAGSYVPTYHRA